ncbi:hypothetical protein HGRIS_003846 [Hohenbuehelia grisea]|uniref:Uncharacterized protein n=1 Tax=Hohenbuehelia grisea TaxID=104357 RepID=A0ABR3JGL9_9AGAR
MGQRSSLRRCLTLPCTDTLSRKHDNSTRAGLRKLGCESRLNSTSDSSRRRKAAEKLRKAQELRAKLEKVQLIKLVDEIGRLKNPQLDEQIEVLRLLWNDTEIPLKSHIKKKEMKVAALTDAFKCHQANLVQLSNQSPGAGSTASPLVVGVLEGFAETTVPDWEEQEEEEAEWNDQLVSE